MQSRYIVIFTVSGCALKRHVRLFFEYIFIMKRQKLWFYTKRAALAALAVLLVILVPLTKSYSDSNLQRLYSIFLGKKSEYSGIIQIWNIDSFESGSRSKNSFLNEAARVFEEQNKGLYVLVRNLSEYECLTLLSEGQAPDLFSCSYGVAGKIRQYLSPFDSGSEELLTNFAEAGKSQGKQYALAWCFNMYCLISTAKSLEGAGKGAEASLSDIALNSGYSVKGKKGEEIVYSLCYGINKYSVAKSIFLAYTGKELVSTSKDSILPDCRTPFQAYSNFVTGKSVILLGSLRDYFRMQQRERLGKAEGTLCEFVSGGTDLVQFLLKADIKDAKRSGAAEEFAKFLLCEKGQKMLSSIGLVSPTALYKTQYTNGIMSHIGHENIESYTVFNVFDEIFTETDS